MRGIGSFGVKGGLVDAGTERQCGENREVVARSLIRF